MADLIATTPFAGLLPLTIGAATLAEADLGAITSLAPYRGKADALSAALDTAHGLALPETGAMAAAEGTRAIWAGLDLWFLTGPAADPALAAHAALTDQSGAWAVAELSGPSSEDVLARLCPLDLSAKAFPPGSAARTLIGHMSALVARSGEDRFLLFVFRSMARTAAHEFETAMKGVAARAALT